MQQHKSIWWTEAVCPICYQKFYYIEGNPQPKTCWKFDCIKKYHLKGIEKFVDAETYSTLMSNTLLTSNSKVI